MQCDPTQCRQNKLYPGTGIKSKSAKGNDQRKRDRKDVSPNEVSQMSNGISATETCHEGHPLKRVKGFSSLSPNVPKLVKQPEEVQTQSHHQGCTDQALAQASKRTFILLSFRLLTPIAPRRTIRFLAALNIPHCIWLATRWTLLQTRNEFHKVASCFHQLTTWIIV